MQYNTLKEGLIIPEYGRHVQLMVNHCKKITDDKERNIFAKAIIDVMGNLNPHLRDIPDFQHKLWDQLFIMSDFDLDVESPYSIPTEEEIKTPPNNVAYPVPNRKYRYYGNNTKKMINVIVKWEEEGTESEEKKMAFSIIVANHMKKCYLRWNKDQVDDETIFSHLRDMSDKKIDLTNSGKILQVFEGVKTTFTKKTNNHNNNNKRRYKR